MKDWKKKLKEMEFDYTSMLGDDGIEFDDHIVYSQMHEKSFNELVGFIKQVEKEAKIEVLEELKKKSQSTVADYQVAILYEEDIDDMLSKLKEDK